MAPRVRAWLPARVRAWLPDNEYTVLAQAGENRGHHPPPHRHAPPPPRDFQAVTAGSRLFRGGWHGLLPPAPRRPDPPVPTPEATDQEVAQAILKVLYPRAQALAFISQANLVGPPGMTILSFLPSL